MLVIGIGQAGCNFINGCDGAYPEKADYVAIDTDKLTIDLCRAEDKLLIPKNVRAVSARAIPFVVGKDTFDEAASEIKQLLEKHKCADVVIVVGASGSGGGIAPYVASMAKDMGIEVKVVTYTPFRGEPRAKVESAIASLNAYKELGLDECVIKVDNNKCLEMAADSSDAPGGGSLADEMKRLDERVREMVFG